MSKDSISVLSRSELIARVIDAKSGDEQARNDVLQSTYLLSWKVAREVIERLQHQDRHFDIEDLANEGMFGVLRAIEKFDPDRGMAFTTYACWWIKSAQSSYIRGNRNSIRLPILWYEDDAPEWKKSRREQLTTIKTNIGFYEIPYSDDSLSYIDEQDAKYTVSDMLQAIDQLPRRKRETILRRMNGETLRKVGRDLDMSQEWTRQIELQAVREVEFIMVSKKSSRQRRSCDGQDH